MASALRSFAAALACAAIFQALAQPPDPAPRPRVGLVLSGGGARGLSHIGVLKVLAEQRIPVDFIVATSMGSIVGGAYAAGRTPAQMEELVREANWAQIFSDRAPREDLSFRRKEDDMRFIGKTELGFKDGGFVLPRGALGSQNLEEFLRSISRHANDAATLNELPILFRAVATDLETGRPVVLDDVPLSVAMRASMSIPGAFAPAEVGGRLLGDGGLVRNLPVEAARELGADVIIAVNVGTPLLPREALSSALGVAQQMINILTEANVEASLGKLMPRDILISPDLTGVSFVDFQRGKELIEIGERAGRAMASRLAALSVSPEQYAAWESQRQRFAAVPVLAVAEIRVVGAKRTNPEALRREVADRAGVAVGSKPTEEDLVKAARVIHGSGEFERVDVRTVLEKGRRAVVIDVNEKPWGPDYIRFGARAVSDFGTEASFTVTLQHTRTWINSWGAEWRNEVALGDVRRFLTSFYQPLGPGSPWFVESTLQAIKGNHDVYESFRRTDRFTRQTQGAYFSAGRRLGNVGVIRFGVGHERYESEPTISSRFEGTETDGANVARMGVLFDTLDDANFPRRGYAVNADALRFDYRDAADPVHVWQGSALVPFTFGNLTLTGLLGAQGSRDDRASFGMGGLFNLSGTPPGSISGSQVGLAAGLAYWRMGQVRGALGGDWYVGASLEAGKAWQRANPSGRRDLHKAASLFMGLDSLVGPLYFAWGKTFGGDSAFYIFLGRPVNNFQ
ncbi:MAG TPA: patatin-like phospholipase family protein [Usitatibacter sp.]|nr:patatin-like phospholipase family protein [Usitatibacter sp.]